MKTVPLTLKRERESYQDAGEDFGMLNICSAGASDVLQIAVQEGAQDSHVVAHQCPHDLTRLYGQLLKAKDVQF